MDLGYAGAFLGGLLSLLSPCSVVLLPAFFAFAFSSPRALLSRTAVFTVGLIATLVPLGVFSATLGSLLGADRTLLVTGAAVVVIAVGLLQLSGLPLPGLSNTIAHGDRTSLVSVFFLGTVYAVAGTCTGPILGSVLMIASLGGSPWYGGAVMTLYALGMAVPLFVLAALWQRFGDRVSRWLRPRTVSIGRWHNSWAMIVSGLLSIAIGVLLLVTDGTAALGGILTVGTQFQLESAVGAAGARIPDAVVVVVVAVVLLAVVVLRSRWRAKDANGRTEAVHDHH